MLSSGLVASLLLLLLQVAIPVDAKPANKPYKIDGPFIEKFRTEGTSRQKRFLDGFFNKVFDISEKDFLNTDWKGNIFNNHHQYWKPYVPNVSQYYPGWSVASNACILSNNKKVAVVSSIRECQVMCLQEGDFICRAVEYEPYSGTCSLTDQTSSSAEYVQPCTSEGWHFIERIKDWTEPTYACIYSTHKKIMEEKIWSLDDCKARCIEETNFECRSIGYIWWTQTCSLSPETSYSPNFMVPCGIQQYIYVERLFVSPSGNPCNDDPCGPNSACFPNGNSFNCQCADGFAGTPPNCNQFQGCANHNDCPSNHACVDWICVDPCVDHCGDNSICQIYNHYPSCTCLENYTGNPYDHCSEIAIVTPVGTSTTDPTTTATTITNTTTETILGCAAHSDCPYNNACVGGTCRDPCADRCAPNAECQVTNLQGFCTCLANFTGNPYLNCTDIDPVPVTTVSIGETTEHTDATTELPEEPSETTTEVSQGFETTIAVESQTDANDNGTVTDPLKDTDTESTDDPIVPTEDKIAPTETPIASTETPIAPTEAPIATTKAPLAPSETTIAQTVAPVTPTETPIVPTDASVTPSETPIAPSEASVTPTEEYTEATETETSLTDVTDLQEEMTTVDPAVRRRIEFPDFNR